MDPAAPELPPSPKKGLPTLAWVGIGCGGVLVFAAVVLLLIGILVTKKVREFAAEMDNDPVRAGAELVVRFNPDLEIVGEDKTNGTLTLRTKSTGEQVTLSYADVAEGRLKLSTPDGELNFGAAGGDQPQVTVTGPDGELFTAGTVAVASLPGWVRTAIAPTEATVLPGYSAVSAGASNGTFTVTTDLAVPEVAANARRTLVEAGLTIDAGPTAMASEATNQTAAVAGEDATTGRRISIVIIRTGATTQSTVSFSETPPAR